MRRSVTLNDRWCFETNQSQTSFYQNNFSLREPTRAIKSCQIKKDTAKEELFLKDLSYTSPCIVLVVAEQKF